VWLNCIYPDVCLPQLRERSKGMAFDQKITIENGNKAIIIELFKKKVLTQWKVG